MIRVGYGLRAVEQESKPNEEKGRQAEIPKSRGKKHDAQPIAKGGVALRVGVVLCELKCEGWAWFRGLLAPG